ncbi:MAG: GNAT family protein [Pseudomonadota bacterium]|nr:GNAT family protein [Pseudomonadota bacterium]
MIETKRLLLRRTEMRDLDDFHAIFTHPKAMRYWSALPHESIQQTEEIVSAMVKVDHGFSDDFAVEYEGRVVGKAGCWRVGEIGFIFHPDVWGQGIATEALAAAIPHAFETLPMEKIEADVDPRNASSLAVLRKFRFCEVGRAEKTFLLGDEWCDSIYLELTRTGWLSRAKS